MQVSIPYKQYSGECLYIVGNVEYKKLRSHLWNQNVFPIKVDGKAVVTIRIREVVASNVGAAREVMLLSSTSRAPMSIKFPEAKWVGSLVNEKEERSLNLGGYSTNLISIMTLREVYNLPIDSKPVSSFQYLRDEGGVYFSISDGNSLILTGNVSFKANPSLDDVAYFVTQLTRSDYLNQVLFPQMIKGSFFAQGWNAEDELLFGEDSLVGDLLSQLEFTPRIVVHYPLYSSVFQRPSNWMPPVKRTDS